MLHSPHNGKYPLLTFLLLSILTLYSSCTDESEYLPDAPVAATFIPEITSPNEGTTRVNTDNQWTAGEIIGICMIPTTGTLPDNADFKQFIPPSPGDVDYPRPYVTFKPRNADQTIYYPSDEKEYRRFIAFCPYSASISNNRISYNLAYQSSQGSMEDVDFMHHKGTTNYNKKSGAVPMEFTHKFSRIKITLTKGAGADNDDFTAQKNLKINNVYTSISCNLSDGSIYSRGSDNGTITPYRSSPNEINSSTTEITYWAIVAPGTYSPTIDFGGVTNYTLTNHNYIAGSSYEYEFEMVGTDIVVGESKIKPWLGGTITWDWQYYLQVGEKELTHYKEVSTGNTVKVYSDYDKTPTASATSTGDWINNCKVTKVSGRQEEYQLTYDVEVNTGSSARSGKITITAGGLSVEVAVNQINTSNPVIYGAELTNCYIVPPGGTILYIPVEGMVKNARKINSNHPVLLSGVSYTPILLWCDEKDNRTAGLMKSIDMSYILSTDANIADISYNSDTKQIRVTTGKKEGNALVALMNSDGNLLWSWHIWVTDYDPDYEAYTIYGTANKLRMARNLGAYGTDPKTKYGLYYQQGRKDPLRFKYGANSSELFWQRDDYFTNTYTQEKLLRSYSKLNLTESFSKPTTYYATGDYGHWLSEQPPLIEATEIAINPCPSGWTVGTPIEPNVNWYVEYDRNWTYYGTYNNIYIPAAGSLKAADPGYGSDGLAVMWTSMQISMSSSFSAQLINCNITYGPAYFSSYAASAGATVRCAQK